MSTDNPDQPPSAPKWERLPISVRLRLAHLIANHLRAHGSEDYRALRDHPEFAEWFGTHLGYRGEKRFDRMVAWVRRAQPQKTGRRADPRASAAIPIEPSPAPAEAGASTHVAQLLASGGAPSFEALQTGLWRRLAELETAIAGCVNDFGEIVDPKVYNELASGHRATTMAIAQLSKQYHAALSSPPVLEPMVVEMLDAAGDPDAARKRATAMSALLKQETGLHAIRSKP